MAVPPLKGKQPSAEYKPSRLSQQVNPESTDDERVPESHSVLSPDSQIVVPETQFGHSDDVRPDEQVPFSPKTHAVLERSAIEKSTEPVKPLDLPGTFISRPPASGEDSLTAESTVHFTFEQPPKAAKKLILSAEPVVVQPNIEPPHTQYKTSQGAQAVTAPADLANVTADELPNTPLHDDGRHIQEVQTSASGVFNASSSSGEKDGSRVEAPGVIPEHLPSALLNTESADSKKKTRIAGKGKKGKKRQHRGVPWPPRPLCTKPTRTEPTPMVETTFEDTITAPMLSRPAVVAEDSHDPPSCLEADLEQDQDRTSCFPAPSTMGEVSSTVRTSRRPQNLSRAVGRTPAKDLSHKPSRRSVPHLPIDESVFNDSEERFVQYAQVDMQDDNEVVHEPQLYMEDGCEMVQDQQYSKVREPHVSPEHRYQHVSDTPSCLPMEQPDLSSQTDLRDNTNLLHREETTLRFPAEHEPRKRHARRPKPQYSNAGNLQGPSNQLQKTTKLDSHLPQVDQSLARGDYQEQYIDRFPAHGGHDQHLPGGSVLHEDLHQQPVDGNYTHFEHQQPQADAVLHGVSDLNGPYRVGKAQKKRRAQHKVMAPPAFPNLEGVPQSEFDKALATLSLAHHTDQSRKDRDAKIQAQRSEDEKASLQDQITQLSATIAEWKDKYTALNTVVVGFREKAKTNQKFVSGLQKDHEKLQKSVVTIRNECKKVLQENIAELEHEKELLLHQIELTLAGLEKGQRKSKATIDELYVDLRISQSKRKDLEENLTKQIAMYEEEKTKRDNLEKRLLPSVQTVQQQLEDRSSQLIKTLDTLRNSVEGVAAGSKTSDSLQKCVDTLRGIQARPSMTSKDLEGSERMLRLVHDGLFAKLDALVKSVETRTDPTENIQTFISTQFQGLRSEMLKFDEVMAESRKAQDLHGTLNTELAAEREKSRETMKQIETLNSQEEELKKQKIQLERRLAEANDQIRDQNTDNLALRKNAEDLRQQVQSAEDGYKKAKDEVERLGKNIEKRNKKIADFEESIKQLRDSNNKLAEGAHSQKPPDLVELRKEVEKALRLEFSSKERDHRNDIYRLSEDLKEKKKLAREHHKNMDAAKARCQESDNAIKGLQSQLDVARKEKAGLEERLKTVHRTAQSESPNAAEMGKVKEQLRENVQELQDKTREYAKLEREHAELQSSQRNLQVLLEQQQTEMSQHSARIDSLRQENEAERRSEQTQSKNTTGLAQSQIRTLKKEKIDLQAKLDHAHRSESKLNEDRNTLITERDGFRSRITELEAAEKTSASEIARAHEEKVDTVQKYEEQLNTLQRDQERSNADLKEAEAKIQLQKSEHQKKIDFDRQRYESIVKTLTEELGKVKAHATNRDDTQQKGPKPTSPQQPTVHSSHSQTAQTGKTRKKVSRENQTVLDVAGGSGTLVSALAQGTARGRNQGFDRSDNLFDEEHDTFGSDKPDEDRGCSIVDPAAVLVEDTQDLSGVLPSFAEDTQEMDEAFQPFAEESQDIRVFSQFAQDTQDIGGAFPPLSNMAIQVGQKPCDESSLSGPMTTDDLDQLIEDDRTIRTPVPQKHHRTQHSPQEMIPETPIRRGNASLSGSQSSQPHDRPRSQANTASRMMPPPGTVSAHFGQPKPSPSARSKKASRQQAFSKLDDGRGRGNDSPPDSGDHPFSLSNLKYDARRRSRTEDSVEPQEHSHSQKRKLNFDQDMRSKRQRTPSRSLSNRLSPGSRSYSTHRSLSKPSRSSDSRNMATLQTSPSSNEFSKHLSGSSDHARETSSRKISAKTASQSRSQQSSASKSSVSSHAARLYGRHQTRSKSKTQDIERFDREIRGE